jgi:hypothetical protein
VPNTAAEENEKNKSTATAEFGIDDETDPNS